MKTKRFLALLLTVVMLLGVMPMTAFAYFEEPNAEGNTELETTVYDYTKPVGVTMQRLKGNCKTETDNLGDDLLFVIKSGDRYYAMQDVEAREEEYTSIPAVDITAWINADGSLTVPADTLGVAFLRYEERSMYELGMFINGREDYLAYTEHYESVDGDDDYYNDAERIYTGAFKIKTFTEGSYISSKPYYWSENEVSGTLKFNGSWSYYYNSYNSTTLRYQVIVDLRSDGAGGQEFYFRYLGTNVDYTGEEVEGYLYYADCRHQYTIRHAEYDAPTCMLKGCEEYWYCEGCDEYYADEAMTQLFGEEMPIIPATGHDWDNETCKNCDRPVPVYSKVTNQAQFDALADDTMFILVAEYNEKYYAMDFSEVYAYMTDSDGDGFYDIHDVDDDSDGIPDYLEFDEGGGGEWHDEPNGVYDYLEWDMDSDGDVDDYDLHEFHIMICNQHLTDMLYNNGGINATEITIDSDGTISHEEAKKTAEFEMVDVYLAEDYNPDWHSHWENGVMPYHTKCVKQFVIPNYYLTAPSMCPIERMYQQRIYDFGDSSHWGVIFYDSRDEYYSYVDGDLNVKVDADEDGKPDPLPFPDISKEGSVAVFDTFDDIAWILYDEGQMAQLRLRDYNGTIGFVTGHDYELEGWEWVDDDTYEDGGYYDTHDTQACVYLYASAPYESHTCDFGDWVDDEVTETHTHTCKDPECGKTETEAHKWDDGVQTGTPTCTEGATVTYTCTGCGKTRTEEVSALGHDWGEWTDDGESSPTDTHSRTCKRNCGVAAEIENHNWSRWTSVDDNTHKKTCSTCNATRTAAHNWAEGVVAKEPTELEEGLMTYTCGDCGHTKSEPIPKLNHSLSLVPAKDPTCTEDGNVAHYYCGGCQRYYSDEAGTTEIAAADVIRERLGHDWSEWTYDGVDSHIRHCKRENCDAEEFDAHNWGEWTAYDDNTHRLTCSVCHGYREEEHDWDNGVETVAPTCYSTGVMTYTCGTCGHIKTEEIPMTEHIWTDWAPNGDENHKRECMDDACDAFETLPHDWDDGVVTTEPSCTEKGVKTYTCGTCQYTRTEELPKMEHQWTEWSFNGDGTHTRACRCNANETADCTYDNGVVTKEPTYEAAGTKTYTCTACGGTKNEALDMLIKADEIVSPDNSEIKITAPEGSNAVLNQNTVIKVEEVKDEVSEDVKANVQIVVGNDNAEVLASYDISLLLDGASVQPGGAVEVTLPAPENAADFDTLQVVYIDDNGNVTPCETRVNADGTVTFVTDHFSHYAIVGIQNTSPIVWILISAISVALIAGAVVAVLVIKKKKGIA